ncbi:MAG: hypothetical protein GHCLOJNM_04158 [bacterium]|nr:hypothetical protein [bacterium]
MRRLEVILILSVLLAKAAGGVSVNDSPPPPGTWGFRPSEDQPAEVNPPSFTWRPLEEASGYALQVSDASEFSNLIYEVTRTPWSAHCPSILFPVDKTLYWRYSAFDPEGNRSGWSETRRFTLAPDAPACPQPTLSDLRKRIPKEHPRLLLRPEEVAGLRGLANGPQAGRWAALLKQCDEWLKRPPDTSPPPLYPEGIERKGEEWKKIWWGNRDRSMNLGEAASTLAFVGLISGEDKYSRAARDLLMAMCEWDPEGASEYSYNDEAAMPLLYLPSRAYSWAYSALSESDRSRVCEIMRVRGRQCFDHLGGNQHLWEPYESHRNRAWHFLGELALAFLDEIPEAETWLEFSLTVFHGCYPVWGDRDGGWHEGVPYWKSYLERFGFWTLLMDSAFGIDVFERPFFKRTGYFALYMAPPGTRHTAFGDMSSGVQTPSACGPLMAMLAAGAGNPHWKWYADQVRGDFREDPIGFLQAARARVGEGMPPTDLPRSTCFQGVGVAVMNTNLTDASDNIQLFFKSSPMGSVSHGFNANNTFHLNIGGEPALLNTGRRDIHGSPHHRRWMWNTRSQNAILVDGEGQRAHSPLALGRITHFETHPSFDIVVGEAGESYENLRRWTRALIFLKPDTVVIHDVLEAPYEVPFDWLLHAPSQFELHPDSSPPRALWSGAKGSVEVRFLAPEGLALSQRDGYDPPPANWAGFDLSEWHLTAKPRGSSKKQEFVTLIRVNPDSATHDYDWTTKGQTLSISRNGSRAKVELAPDCLRVRGEGTEAVALY